MIEGEMGAVKQKEGLQSLYLLGALGRVGWGGSVTKLQVKVSARDGRTLDWWKGQEKGRGRTICFATVVCGGPWGEGELAGR